MRSTFKATVKMLLRTPGAIVWALAFPILMATLFMFMFSSMRTDGAVDAVPVAVVADGAWEESTFSQVIESLASGDDALVAVREVDDATEARSLLEEGEVDGTFEVDEAGVPHLTVAPESSDAHQGERGRSYGINRSILETLASSYVQSAALIEEVAASDPAALADPEAVARALTLEAGSERPTRRCATTTPSWAWQRSSRRSSPCLPWRTSGPLPRPSPRGALSPG